MTTLKVAAAQIKQGDLVLYATSIKVRDLVASGFYSVETLDPNNTDAQGYQRLLNVARAKRLSDYIVKGQDSKDAFLPTSVFLATSKTIPFDSSTNVLSIDSKVLGPFSVVDGQHRLEGLKMAAQQDDRVLDFEVPVNIAISLSRIAQMCHFLIVNTTQKGVDKSVEQNIIARLTDAIDVEEMPNLPKWISKIVDRGEVDKALKMVTYLNSVDESPWKGKIEMANSTEDGTTVSQRSFVKAIVKYVLTANNPLVTLKDFEKEKKVFLNYWRAIANKLDDGNPSVIYRYNGIELFCRFSIPFFMKCQNKGSYTVSSMEALLAHAFENMEGENAAVGHPDFWARGSKASGLNSGALYPIVHEMAKALNSGSAGGQVEI